VRQAARTLGVPGYSQTRLTALGSRRPTQIAGRYPAVLPGYSHPRLATLGSRRPTQIATVTREFLPGYSQTRLTALGSRRPDADCNRYSGVPAGLFSDAPDGAS